MAIHHLDRAVLHVNIEAQHADMAAHHVDMATHHVDMAAHHVDMAAHHVDMAALHVDMAALHVDGPAGNFTLLLRCGAGTARIDAVRGGNIRPVKMSRISGLSRAWRRSMDGVCPRRRGGVVEGNAFAPPTTRANVIGNLQFAICD
jgi:hypothetical protein